MTLTCIKWNAALLCAIIVASVPVLAQQPADADLAAAREAVQKGRWKVIEELKPRFAGTLLEAYPSYWLLDGNIDRAGAAEVRAFLAKYPSGPLAENLRRDWLKALGASADWDIFRAEYPRLIFDDAETACYAFQERLARADPQAGPEARALFLEGREAPAPCDPVFATLAERGNVSEADIWARMRKLFTAGHVKAAKRANELLPKPQRIPDVAIHRASTKPESFLAHLKGGKLDRPTRELVIFAIARLAANHPDDAAAFLATFADRLGADMPCTWAEVAWQGAMELHESALDWYARTGSCKLSDAQIAWKARAALRAGDWKQVLSAIKALSPETARDPTWRYWRARALRETGDPAGAASLLRSISTLPTFYGLLASEDLGIPSAPEWNGFHPSAAELDRVRALPGIQRALVLYHAGLDNDALREWSWAIRDLDDRSLLAAARVAAEADVPDRAISTADRTLQLHDFSQRYPVPHREALDAAARQWDLDEAFVYGIIRQESRFLAQARSPVGAVGLMQLMPTTARWIARQLPLKPFHTDMLMRPEVNVAMGTYYLHRVLEALGQPILAAAAYNAGPARARRWRDDKALEGAIYAETIPYPETRDYVKKVFTNAWYYRHRLGGTPASLRQLLGTVAGRASSDSFAANIP